MRIPYTATAAGKRGIVPVVMHKAEKYAFYGKYCPDELKHFLFGNFGCARKVYNIYVDFLYNQLEKKNFTNGLLPDVKLPEVSELKKKYAYLKEADALGLANAKGDFEKSMDRYNKEYDHVSYTKRAKRRDKSGTEKLSFRGLKGIPKFHAKARGYFSYTTNCQYPGEGKKLKNPTVRLEGDMLYVPKLKQGVRLTVHRPLPEDAIIKNATFSMDSDGVFYASINYEYVIMMDTRLKNAASDGDVSIMDRLLFLGLDYSQPDFYVDSEGRKANYPHYYRNSEKKLAKLQHQLLRMEKGSRNYEKKTETNQKTSRQDQKSEAGLCETGGFLSCKKLRRCSCRGY